MTPVLHAARHRRAARRSAAADRLAALVAEAVADARRPGASGLPAGPGRGGDPASGSLGTALVRERPLPDAGILRRRVPAVASRLYARTGRAAAALLLAGLAVQLQPRHESARTALHDLQAAHAAAAAAPDAEIAGRAAGDRPRTRARGCCCSRWRRSTPKRGRPAVDRPFEAVWGRVRPMGNTGSTTACRQVYRRAGPWRRLCAAGDAGDPDRAFKPRVRPSARLLLRYFRGAGRIRDARNLCVRRTGLCPEPVLLSARKVAALLAEAGPLGLSPPRAGRQDRH